MNKILTFAQFMVITGGLLIVGGVLFLAIPNWMWYVLGLHFNARDMVFLARAQVPWSLSMGILALLLREQDVSEPDARAYLWALVVGSALAFFIAAYAALAGVINGVGWFAVIIFLAMGLMGGYFLAVGDG